jgi:hypothetical protein
VRYDGAKPQSCVVENFCTMGGQSLLSLPGTMENSFSLNFRHYNLTIRWDLFSSLVQDPMVKSAKKMKKNSVGLLELETADLEYFLEKTPLNPLGVKQPH